MAIEVIDTGTSPNSRDGDSLRLSFQKVNANFEQLDELVNSCIEALDVVSGRVTDPPITSVGEEGNLKDQIAVDGNYFYYCIADYVNDSTVIWQRVHWDSTAW